MTGEEMERAIEFLLQSQANLEAQVREIGRQAAETEQRLSIYAEMQTVFIQTVTRSLEAQDQINASLRAADARTDERWAQADARTEERLAQADARTEARLAQTDERLNKLIRLFEQHIVTGH